MKRKWIISIVLMLMVSLVPLSLADEADDAQQDEVELDDETREEVEILNDQIGACIRLLQLEKAITKNIIKGEEVVSVLDNLEINTTGLEAIIAELELLKEEVQSVDPNLTDVVQIFVDLKSDAVELTKDFRDTLKELINETTLEQLRERLREMVCEQVHNLSKKIQNRIRLFNRNQLHRIYGFLGEINGSFLNEYQNGNLTKEQVKQQISKMVNQMTKEKRNQIFAELKEYKIRSRIHARACVENATDGFHERKEVRLTNRLRHAQDSQNNFDSRVRAEMEKRMNNRLNGDGGTDSGSSSGDGGNGSGSGDGGNGGNNPSGGSGK